MKNVVSRGRSTRIIILLFFLQIESQIVSTNKTVNKLPIQSFKVSDKIVGQIFHNSYLSLTLSSAVSISIGKWEEMKESKLVKSKLID